MLEINGFRSRNKSKFIITMFTMVVKLKSIRIYVGKIKMKITT